MMSRALTTLLLVSSTVLAHGGQFSPPTGQPRIPTPPGLPAQPTAPPQTGKIVHDWLTWWSYTQFQYLDFRRHQEARRGPVSGTDAPKDAEAWRDELRARLIPVLREALKDRDKEVRTAAAVALGKLEAKQAVDDLLRMLERDKLQEGREAALVGLMYLRVPKLRGTFEELVAKQSEELRVRGFALFGLGRLGDAQAVEFLKGFFDRKNRKARGMLPTSKGEIRQFRVACLAALLLSEAKDLDDFFLAVSRDERLDEEVRAYAVTALGKRRARGKLKELVELVGDARADDQLRRSAAVAIGVVGEPTDLDAIAALVGVCDLGAMKRQKDDVLRHFALVSLGRIGGEDAVQHLLDTEKRAKTEDREFTLIALGLSRDKRAGPLLVDALRREKNAKRKAAAAIALGLHGDRRLGAEVHAEFEEAKDWLLLQSCALSCGMLNYKPASDRLEEVLTKKKQPALRTAAALGYAMLKQHQAVPLFVDLLKATDSVVTMTALVRVMRFLPSPKAAEPLEELYADEKLQRQIRAYALVTLGQLADRDTFPLLVTLAFDINYLIRCPPLDEAMTIL